MPNEWMDEWMNSLVARIGPGWEIGRGIVYGSNAKRYSIELSKRIVIKNKGVIYAYDFLVIVFLIWIFALIHTEIN